MEGAVEAGERAARSVREEAKLPSLLSPTLFLYLTFLDLDMNKYVCLFFFAPYSTQGAHLWPAVP